MAGLAAAEPAEAETTPAEADDGLRVGVLLPDDPAESACSAGVEGGGWGPGGDSERTDGMAVLADGLGSN